MSLPKVVRLGWCLSMFLKVEGMFVKETGLFLVCFSFSCKTEGAILIVFSLDLVRDREKMQMPFAHVVFVQ